MISFQKTIHLSHESVHDLFPCKRLRLDTEFALKNVTLESHISAVNTPRNGVCLFNTSTDCFCTAASRSPMYGRHGWHHKAKSSAVIIHPIEIMSKKYTHLR